MMPWQPHLEALVWCTILMTSCLVNVTVDARVGLEILVGSFLAGNLSTTGCTTKIATLYGFGGNYAFYFQGRSSPSK